MRVLHVSTDMAREDRGVAGNTACTRRLLTELGRHVELTVWSTRQAKRPGTPWAALRKAAILSGWMFRPLHRYDVVIALTPYAMFAMLLPCHLWRKPLIYDIDDNLLPDLERFPLLPRLEWTNRRKASAIRSISRHLVDYLLATGIDTPTRYVPHGIDLSTVPLESAPRPSAAEGRFLLGYAGGFQPYQGIERLLDAMAVLPADVHLLLVGHDADDPAHRTIKQRVDHTPRVTLLPRQTTDDAMRLLNACDALVLPRPHTPIGVTAAPTKFVEYCALGKPVVVTDVGDAADWVRQYECGAVAEDASATRLAEAIMQVRQADAAEFGRRARTLAEQEFGIQKVAHGYVSLLSDVLGTGSTRCWKPKSH
jgi:glycosyltransferase involved in cell wall biosynthesis